MFEKTVHLRCFLHCKPNLDMKSREYGVTKNVRNKFLREIFGGTQDLETGLVKSEQDFEVHDS